MNRDCEQPSLYINESYVGLSPKCSFMKEIYGLVFVFADSCRFSVEILFIISFKSLRMIMLIQNVWSFGKKCKVLCLHVDSIYCDFCLQYYCMKYLYMKVLPFLVSFSLLWLCVILFHTYFLLWSNSVQPSQKFPLVINKQKTINLVAFCISYKCYVIAI